jgi:hypothetical protein
MGFRTIPVIPRTTRPSIAGTPVWYAEATTARTQLDISITIPSGSSRKLVVLWGSNGGEFPTAVTFDPAGVALPMIPIDGAFGSAGSYFIGAWYLNAPPDGAKVVRITTANALRSVVSLKVYQDARAGDAQGGALSTDATSVSQLLDESFLLDAYSETCDLVLGDGLSDGGLTPNSGQTAGADDVVNGTFLATTSVRTHSNYGGVLMGWTAASATSLLHAVVNILFSTGQIAASNFQALSVWNFDETAGTTYSDALGRSNAAKTSGTTAGGAGPLFSGGGASVSVQGAIITAAHHVDWQVSSWTVEIYLQPRAWPLLGRTKRFWERIAGCRSLAAGSANLRMMARSTSTFGMQPACKALRYTSRLLKERAR